MRTLALLALLGLQDDAFEQLRGVRQAIRERRDGGARLVKEAHQALDQGEYEAAVLRHKEARRLEAERVDLVARERVLIERVTALHVPELASDDPGVRDRASARLVALGPAAVPVLEKALESGKGAEARARISDLIPMLREMEVDGDGRLRQWAIAARASSEYTAESWSAMQATGRPDTAQAGDAQTAWATLEEDKEEEWLELTYRHWVRPTLVRVHETFNPGAVVKIEAMDPAGKWRPLWEGREPAKEPIRWLEAHVPSATFVTRRIRLTLDSAVVRGWNEIDAVELAGDAALPPK